MKQCLGLLFAAVLVVSISACTGGGGEQDTSWVLGKWELAHNPENDDEDALVFDSDGTVTVLAVKGGKLKGSYQFSGDTLKVTLLGARKTIDVEFEVSSDHSKLIYESGAYYMKK